MFGFVIYGFISTTSLSLGGPFRDTIYYKTVWILGRPSQSVAFRISETEPILLPSSGAQLSRRLFLGVSLTLDDALLRRLDGPGDGDAVTDLDLDRLTERE